MHKQRNLFGRVDAPAGKVEVPGAAVVEHIISPVIIMLDRVEDSLGSFFNARRGRLSGFRFRDPAAFSSAAPGMAESPTDEMLGTGDGTRTVFQLAIVDGGIERAVLKPVAQSVRIGVNGAELLSGWEVDEVTGEVAFDVVPEEGAILTAGFEYDWPVRFDTDALEVSFETAGSGRVVSLPLVEIF